MSCILTLTKRKIEHRFHLQKQKNNFKMLLRVYFQKSKNILKFNLLKKNIMTSLINIGIGLIYLPISKSRLIFIISEFITGGVL